MSSRDCTGHIFDIQRFSLHDGPGIRTTVFLQGCPLRCAWCHNPEGLIPRPLLSYLRDRCTSCGQCSMACPHNVHSFQSGEHLLHRVRCNGCGTCVRACGQGALELVGRSTTVGEIIDEVLKDEMFYRNSGGGITISGGEPTAQVAFLEALLKAAAEHQIHRALETCGHAPWDQLDRIRPLVDLFLFDLKHTDSERHLELTGQRNELILSNLRQLHDAGAIIALRLPIVPNLNDGDDHFSGVARLLRDLPRIDQVELMPFHPMGESKRERFGLEPSPVSSLPPVGREAIDGWIRRLAQLGVNAVCSA